MNRGDLVLLMGGSCGCHTHLLPEAVPVSRWFVHTGYHSCDNCSQTPSLFYREVTEGEPEAWLARHPEAIQEMKAKGQHLIDYNQIPGSNP